MSDDLNADLINSIRRRMEQCRRLASATLDERARTVLLEIVADGEADIRRLEADREANLNQPKPPVGS